MIIDSKGTKLEIKTEKELEEKVAESRFLYRHIPLLELSDGAAEALLEVRIGEYFLDFNSEHTKYSNSRIEIKDVVAMAGYMLERKRQEEGVYSMHSNTVDMDGRGVVIFGPPHVGKTTLSLLLAKESSGKVISNDKSLLTPSEGLVSGRIESIELNDFTKIYIKDEKPYIGGGEMPIAMFVHPFLSEKPFIREYHKDAAVWDWIDQTDVLIRGVNRSVLKGKNERQPLISLDTEELAYKRHKELRALAEKVPCYTIAGDYYQIINQIKQNIK